MLMFCFIFRKHKYCDGTVVTLCTATVSVLIYLIFLTFLLSRSFALSHITESACETCLDYVLNSSVREAAYT